jgi:hypothetical protein
MTARSTTGSCGGRGRDSGFQSVCTTSGTQPRRFGQSMIQPTSVARRIFCAIRHSVPPKSTTSWRSRGSQVELWPRPLIGGEAEITKLFEAGETKRSPVVQASVHYCFDMCWSFASAPWAHSLGQCSSLILAVMNHKDFCRSRHVWTLHESRNGTFRDVPPNLMVCQSLPEWSLCLSVARHWGELDLSIRDRSDVGPDLIDLLV